MTTTIDSFEDGGLAEYSGDTGSFAVVDESTVAPSAQDGSKVLEAAGANVLIESTSGLNSYHNKGETARAWFYFTDSQNIATYHYAVTTAGGTRGDQYYATLDVPDDRLALTKVEGGSTFTTSADTTDVTYSTGSWYQLEVDWASDDTHTLKILDDTGSQVGSTITATDGTHGSGGVGVGNFDGGGSTYYVDHARTGTFSAQALAATTGTTTGAGQTATATPSTAAVTAETGTTTNTGQAAVATPGTTAVTAAAGTTTGRGQTTTVRPGQTLTATTGITASTGHAATLAPDATAVTATVGTTVGAGQVATVEVPQVLAATAGTTVAAGQTATAAPGTATLAGTPGTTVGAGQAATITLVEEALLDASVAAERALSASVDDAVTLSGSVREDIALEADINYD
jgi:hypothetical protein